MNTKRVVKVQFDCLTEVSVKGRTLTPGVEASIRGERGRFRFQYARYTKAGKLVLTFVGGPSGYETFRSFYPEKVRTVHRINRTPKNLMRQRREERAS